MRSCKLPPWCRQWYGVVGPAGIPQDVVKKRNGTLNQVLARPDLKVRLASEAIEPLPMTSEG